MAFYEQLTCEVGDDAAAHAAVGSWTLARLQHMAEQAAKEKVRLIRKRLGDYALRVSCKCSLLL